MVLSMFVFFGFGTKPTVIAINYTNPVFEAATQNQKSNVPGYLEGSNYPCLNLVKA